MNIMWNIWWFWMLCAASHDNHNICLFKWCVVWIYAHRNSTICTKYKYKYSILLLDYLFCKCGHLCEAGTHRTTDSHGTYVPCMWIERWGCECLAISFVLFSWFCSFSVREIFCFSLDLPLFGWTVCFCYFFQFTGY